MQRAVTWRSVLWSGLLGLVWPGLGHIYVRAWRIGVAMLCLEMMAALALLGITRLRPTPSLLAVVVVCSGIDLLAVRGFGAIDAMRRARRLSHRPTTVWWRSTWFAALAGLTATVPIAWQGQGWRYFAIPETSNLPNLMPGDWVTVSAWAAGTLPERGEMIVLRLPRDLATEYVKRVAGLPGDRVRMRDGVLMLNGAAVGQAGAGDMLAWDGGQERSLQLWRETLPNGRSHVIARYPEGGPLDDTREFTVPAGHVFVLGDNRDNSLDSRVRGAVGYIPLDHIVGRVEFVYWSNDRSRIATLIE